MTRSRFLRTAVLGVCTLLLTIACGGATAPTATPSPSPTAGAAVAASPTPSLPPTPAPSPTPQAMATSAARHGTATPGMTSDHNGHAAAPNTPSATPQTGEPVVADSLIIRDAWARAATTSDGMSAVYLVIENTGDQPDRLLHAHCEVASTVELHESKMENGMMRMQPVSGVDIPAHSTVELRPGGLHIMLIGLTHDLVPGDELEVELHFERAGHVPVRAIVNQP